MVALLRKCESGLSVHLVMDSDDDCICETMSNGGKCFCWGSKKILPGVEDEGLVDVVKIGEVALGDGSRLGDGDDPALMGV